MRRKCATMILGFVLGISMLGGCAGIDSSVSDKEENADGYLFGEVSKIEENSITVKVGTLKKMEQGEHPPKGEQSEDQLTDNQTGEETDASEKNERQPKEGRQSSMLELTGEEQEIIITDYTTVKRQVRLNESDLKPDEDPEKSDSSKSADKSSKQQRSEMPKGGKQDGEFPAEKEAEEITLKDISEGDTVSITFDENGNAEEITVMSFGGGMGGQPDSIAQFRKAEDEKVVIVKECDGSTYVEGDSSYTTMDVYEDLADLSGASAITIWKDDQAEKMAELE